MIIPVLNMDVTPLVQLLVFVSYIGLFYALVMEIVKDKPFRELAQEKLARMQEEASSSDSEPVEEKESTETVEEKANTETVEEKANTESVEEKKDTKDTETVEEKVETEAVEETENEKAD